MQKTLAEIFHQIYDTVTTYNLYFSGQQFGSRIRKKRGRKLELRTIHNLQKGTFVVEILVIGLAKCWS